MSRIIIVLSLSAFATDTSARAELVVDYWRLVTGVSSNQPHGDPTDFVDFTQVQNPLQNSHTGMVGSSFATAAYDFAWHLDDAQFDINTAHHLAQLEGETITSGRIYFSPAVDSIVTFTGNWQFAWPSAAIGNTDVSVQLGDLDDEVSVLSVTASGGNVGIGPPFGSFTFNEAGLLLANHNYLLVYTAQVLHIDPTPPGSFGEASGDFHFTISPIPEPAAALLLALPLLTKRSRRLP